MESGANLDQRGEPPVDFERSTSRRHNAAQVLQHRAFARTIMTDDAECLALLQLERHIVQHPEFLGRQRALAVPPHCLLHERWNEIAQRIVSLTAAEALEYVVQSQSVGGQLDLLTHSPRSA